MGLFDFFRGKQLVLEDAFFGEIITDTVKSKNINKPIDWYVEYELDGFEEPIFMILTGTNKGIDAKLRDSVIDLMNNWATKYKPELNKILASNPDFKIFSNWENEFIMSLVSSDESGNVEVNFDPIDENSERWFGFSVGDGRILEFDGE